MLTTQYLWLFVTNHFLGDSWSSLPFNWIFQKIMIIRAIIKMLLSFLLLICLKYQEALKTLSHVSIYSIISLNLNHLLCLLRDHHWKIIISNINHAMVFHNSTFLHFNWLNDYYLIPFRCHIHLRLPLPHPLIIHYTCSNTHLSFLHFY